MIKITFDRSITTGSTAHIPIKLTRHFHEKYKSRDRSKEKKNSSFACSFWHSLAYITHIIKRRLSNLSKMILKCFVIWSQRATILIDLIVSWKKKIFPFKINKSSSFVEFFFMCEKLKFEATNNELWGWIGHRVNEEKKISQGCLLCQCTVQKRKRSENFKTLKKSLTRRQKLLSLFN